MAKKRDPRDQQESLFSSPSMLVQESELSAQVCRAHTMVCHSLEHAYDSSADDEAQECWFENASNWAGDAQRLLRKLKKLRGERIAQ